MIQYYLALHKYVSFSSFSHYADDHSLAQLYQRIISPSLKIQNETWQKQTHFRHRNIKSQSTANRLKVASPTHSVVSAPAHLEITDMALQVCHMEQCVTLKSFNNISTLYIVDCITRTQ